jgi:hypothetical protein
VVAVTDAIPSSCPEAQSLAPSNRIHHAGFGAPDDTGLDTPIVRMTVIQSGTSPEIIVQVF